MDSQYEQPIVNITGERIALGPLRRDHLPSYERWRNDFYIQRNTGDVPRPVTREERVAWYERATTSPDTYKFTIYEIATWRPIGLTNLFDIDLRFRSAVFGLMIGEADCRGKGYGTETTRLTLDYAFTALGLHNVMLEVSEYNFAGRRAYEKAGFREIGRRREADLLLGRYWDLILMDCISTEFESPVLGKVFAPDVAR